MRPDTSQQLAIIITAASVGIVLRTFDPEGWKPIGQILRYWWVIFPALISYFVINVILMKWFGKRDESGKTEQYVDPTERRFEQLEAAINRLHNYVQDIDPELAEGNRLEREFLSGEGGMFAGMKHMEYVRDREERGLRTKHTSIWRDVDPERDGEADETV
jgi:hypothetical protein